MDSEAFYSQVKIGDAIHPARFGGLELEAEKDKAKEKAEALGVDTIHTAKVFGGPYLLQFISEMITNWLPNPTGWVQGGKLSAKFIGLVMFNEIATCKGQVRDKVEKEGEKYLVCDVWIENAEGNKVTIGEATISF